MHVRFLFHLRELGSVDYGGKNFCWFCPSCLFNYDSLFFYHLVNTFPARFKLVFTREIPILGNSCSSNNLLANCGSSRLPGTLIQAQPFLILRCWTIEGCSLYEEIKAMNAKYFAALIAIVLTTGLSLPMAHAQACQIVLTSMFNDVLVQPSPLSPSLSKDSAPPPPPVDGRPDERTPGGTRSHNHRWLS